MTGYRRTRLTALAAASPAVSPTGLPAAHPRRPPTMRPGRSLPAVLAVALILAAVPGGLAVGSRAAAAEGQATWANGMNPRVRQQILHKIQQLITDKVMFGPVIEPAFLNGVGPRLEVHGLGPIANHAYSAPYEDLRLKRP